MFEIVNCPKCRTRMRSYMVDTAGAHYRCDFCGFLYPEGVKTYATSTTQMYDTMTTSSNTVMEDNPMKFYLITIEEREGKFCENCGIQSLSVKYAVPKDGVIHYYCNVCVTRII